MSTGRVRLRDRRFAVRFLGRPGAWLWMAAAGVLCVGAWLAFALPSRDAVLGRRAWFLWSGNGLLGMFLVTLAFSLRRWSIKLTRVRDHARTPAAAVEASGIELEELNQRVRTGAYAGEGEIEQAAVDLLARLDVRSLRPVLERDGDRILGVRLEKREPFGRLETWLEMHIGVGTIACVGVLFHADFIVRHALGWTMVVLSAVVLLSGVAGILLYRLVPPLLSRADAGIPFEEATVARQSYQECVVGVLTTLEPAQRKALAPAARTAATRRGIERRNRALLSAVPEELAPLPRDLAVMAGSRDHLGASTARARRLALALRLWKWVHVPISLVLCFAVLLHILSVLYF